MDGTQSWDSARPHFANYVQFRERAGGRVLRVWNTLFDHISQTARENQARILVQAGSVFPDDFRQPLTMDANADATNPALHTLIAGGWLDTCAAVHGPGETGFTFHAFRGPRFPEGRPPERVIGRIDWIFSRGPIETLAAEVIRGCRDDRYPSDHYFISAEVLLR